jgi:hypothetical protein
MSRIALLAAVTFAAITATAHAGGWATVELGEAPTSLVADKPWKVELIVKQHGRTPLDGVMPSVRIANADGVVRDFRATPTGRPGSYVVEVTFPSAGEWRTRLFDGFTDAVPHRLSPLTVTAPGAAPQPALTAKRGTPAPAAAPPAPTPPAEGGFPWPQTIAITLVALIFLAGLMATLERPLPRWRGTVTLRGRHV